MWYDQTTSQRNKTSKIALRRRLQDTEKRGCAKFRGVLIKKGA